MTTIHKRNCDYCKKYYEKQNKRYCSVSCRGMAIRGKNNPNYREPTLKECKCGKSFIFRKGGRERYCSWNCYQKDRLNIITPLQLATLRKHAYAQQKATDEELLATWEECKKNPELPYIKAFSKFGYERVPPKRLKKLISEEEYKEMSKLRGYKQKGNSRYIRGRVAEYLAMEDLKKEGYSVARSAGSKGTWDLIAFNKNHVRVIQIKRTKGKFKGISSAEIRRMKESIVPPNTIKELWVRYDRAKGRKANWEKEKIYSEEIK